MEVIDKRASLVATARLGKGNPLRKGCHGNYFVKILSAKDECQMLAICLRLRKAVPDIFH